MLDVEHFDPPKARESLNEHEGHEAIRLLVEMAKCQSERRKDQKRRIGASWGLCAWQPELAVEPLLSSLKSECRAIRLQAQQIANYLGGEKILDALLANVRNEGPPLVREVVARTVGRSRSPRAVEPLMKLLTKDDELVGVRRAAASGLGDLIEADVATLEQVVETAQSMTRTAQSKDAGADLLYDLLMTTADRLQRRLEPWGEEGAKLKEQREKKEERSQGEGVGGIHVAGDLKMVRSVVAFPGGEVRDSSVNVVEGNHVEQRRERDEIVTPKAERAAQEEAGSDKVDKVPRDACRPPDVLPETKEDRPSARRHLCLGA